MFLSARLVVAFNPQFLSKFDRVYVLRCFYMEMEHQLEKQLTVKSVISFSLLQELIHIFRMGPPVMHTKQVPMPVCRYEVCSLIVFIPKIVGFILRYLVVGLRDHLFSTPPLAKW